MYKRREKEIKGETVQDPQDTIRKMYDKIVMPQLAKRGAHVPLPSEQNHDDKGKEKKKKKKHSDDNAASKRRKGSKKKKKKKHAKKKKKERDIVIIVTVGIIIGIIVCQRVNM